MKNIINIWHVSYCHNNTLYHVYIFFRLILGNYLARQGKIAKNKLKGCFLISVPWNVFAATKSTEENYFNLILNKYLAFSLRQQVKRLHYSSESGMFDVDIDSLLKVRFWLFLSNY